MKYNGTDYNEAWVLRSSLEEFIKHPVNKNKAEQELENVYQLVHAMNVIKPAIVIANVSNKQPWDERSWKPDK